MQGRTVRLWVAACFIGLTVLVFASAARAAGEFEPNDSRETAYGPLSGGKVYTGTFETENDYDWYLFYVKTYSQVEISGSMLPGSYCQGSIRYVELLDGDGQEIRTFEIGATNEIGRLNITLDPGRYYLMFRNRWSECDGDRYNFRIDPAAAITSSRECGEAIVARNAVGPLLAETTAKLTKNTEKLNEKVQAVRKAKRIYKRLRSRRHVSRYEKRGARQRFERAKAAREKVVAVQVGLEGIATQHQGELSAAEAQIAAHC